MLLCAYFPMCLWNRGFNFLFFFSPQYFAHCLQIFDLHHHMGLLILERKELATKLEQVKASTEAAELMHKRNQAAHLASLAEAKKQEDSLKKALGVERQCIASIEKALHEMRAEAAETKVAADCKLAEARIMVEDAQKKFVDAEKKLYAVEALQGEASRYHRTAERKLQEVESREADLRRRITAFKTDCDAKEREIFLERESLSERRKVLQQEHERLLNGQTLLNQREEYLSGKSQELNQLEKVLEASKANIETELKSLNDEKSNLELTMASLSQREEAVIERESLLNKGEQELLILKEKVASKESVEVQKIIANQEAVLRMRKSDFEAELEARRKLVEEEIEAKRRAWELKEIDFSQREGLLLEKEHDLEVQSRALKEKEKDVAERMDFLEEKEKSLAVAEKDFDLRRALLQQEKEETTKLKLELQKTLDALEDKKKQVDCATEKLETVKSETNELSVLEVKLKEEVDCVRAQRLEIMAEEDGLKVEKAKFEAEWELIDEKREELRRQAEHIAEEREAVSRLLKAERDNLRLEKEAARDEHKQVVESFNLEREEIMNKMAQERAQWFSKIQQEQSDFLLGIEMQKKQLEGSIEKRREEVESYLSEKEKAFELVKNNELEHIRLLREKAAQEMEQVTLEMNELDSARMEINLDRERRDREWDVLNKSIEELKNQTLKLEKQRELLRAEREEVCAQVESLKKLEDLKLELDSLEVAKIQLSNMESSQRKILAIRSLEQDASRNHNADLVLHKRTDTGNNEKELESSLWQKLDVTSPPNFARLSWIERCTKLIFKSEKTASGQESGEKSLKPDPGKVSLKSAGKSDCFNGHWGQNSNSSKNFGGQDLGRHAFGEPKVIHEVPSEGEIVTTTCVAESEIKEDSSNRIRDLISEHAFQSGRKRRAGSSPSDNNIGSLPMQSQKNKKRRQQDNADIDLSDDAIDRCLTSTQASDTEERVHESATEGADGDTEKLIMDKIIKISEVTREISEAHNVADQEKPEPLQNSEPMFPQNVAQDGGTDGHANSIDLADSIPTCNPEILDKEASETFKEEHQGNVGLVQDQT
uniref:Uncharacterized protein MANES_12G118800 n=1 Tax=Rhizophora mucronata TaxID=61149 RepID=A0A2P2KLA8_RHIMU